MGCVWIGLIYECLCFWKKFELSHVFGFMWNDKLCDEVRRTGILDCQSWILGPLSLFNFDIEAMWFATKGTGITCLCDLKWKLECEFIQDLTLSPGCKYLTSH